MKGQLKEMENEVRGWKKWNSVRAEEMESSPSYALCGMQVGCVLVNDWRIISSQRNPMVP